MAQEAPIAYSRIEGMGSVDPVFAHSGASKSNEDFQRTQPYGSLDAEMQRRRALAASLGPIAHVPEPVTASTEVVSFSDPVGPHESLTQAVTLGFEDTAIPEPTNIASYRQDTPVQREAQINDLTPTG